MKSRRIAIVLVIVVGLAIGGYFGLMQFRDTTPVLAEGFGILQPEIEIRNIYPGYVATVPLTILCGKDQDRIFAVTLEQPNPNKLKDGYQAFSEDDYPWISIESSYDGGSWSCSRIQFDGAMDFGDPILVDAGHYRKLTIAITMPESSTEYGEQNEVRVRVSEVSATGLVQLAIESKWYIITAPEEALESS